MYVILLRTLLYRIKPTPYTTLERFYYFKLCKNGYFFPNENSRHIRPNTKHDAIIRFPRRNDSDDILPH